MLASLFTLSACDKVPLLAPTGSTISLFASQNVLAINGVTDIVATVVEGAGTPVQNGTLVTFTTTLGTIEPREARTSAGTVTVRFNAGGQSGTAEIKALSGAASTKDPLKIDVGAVAADNVQLAATPGNVPSTGGTVQITATVVDKNGNRVSGVPVGFSADAGTLAAQTVNTNDNGQASTTLTTTKQSKVTARVGTKTAEVTVNVNAAPVITVTVSPSPATATQPVTITVAPGSATGALGNVRVEFGDGDSLLLGTINGSNSVSHQYCAPTTYTVSASGTDVNGERASATAGIGITTVSLSLSASPAGAAERQSITFTASNLSSGAIVTQYEFNFGDGSPIRRQQGNTISYSYQEEGGYSPIVAAINSRCGVLTTASTNVNITKATTLAVTR